MKPMSYSEEIQWAARIVGGEPAAFEQFVDTFGPRVHRLARRYAADECDAEDLTQEIFVALFRSAGNFRGEANFATWVYRVALNHCLRHREKTQRDKPSSQTPNDVPSPTDVETPDLEADPARHAGRRELGQQVRGALDTLVEGQREVVILHELHGLTYSECATILQIPVGTVKSRLSNAFRHLRQRLAPYVLDNLAEANPTQNASTPHKAAPACGEMP
jgi:RNA polymerase sigma-70 factor (ECF subfamily)